MKRHFDESDHDNGVIEAKEDQDHHQEDQDRHHGVPEYRIEYAEFMDEYGIALFSSSHDLLYCYDFKGLEICFVCQSDLAKHLVLFNFTKNLMRSTIDECQLEKISIQNNFTLITAKRYEDDAKFLMHFSIYRNLYKYILEIYRDFSPSQSYDFEQIRMNCRVTEQHYKHARFRFRALNQDRGR
jgi:hypothetical protein